MHNKYSATNLVHCARTIIDYVKESFSGLALFMSILAGAHASKYAEAIYSNLSPFWLAKTFSIEASVFWGLVYLALIFFILGQVVQNKRADKAIGKLDSMIKRLQTLPAEGYLPSYQSCYRVAAANSFLVLLSPETKIEQVELAIRSVLGSILETARDFDKAGEIEYAANIMLWHAEGKDVEATKPLELIPNMINHPDLEGVLELIPALSTTTTNNIKDKYNQDKLVKPILLPIPKNRKPIYDTNMNLRSQLLPGAPYAFIYKVFASYKNINTLFDWLDNDCAASLETINQVKSYFMPNGAGENIRSFGSLPILLPSANATTSEALPLGVLNIHSAKENILEDNGQTLFTPLLEPFLMLLSMLLLKRTELLS